MTGTGSHVFLRGETADQVEKRIAGSWNRKSRVLEWETTEQYEKRIAGSWNRKSRVLEWETAGECENRIVGSRWVKTAELCGLKVQSPIFAVGVILGVKTTQKKNNNKYFLLSYVSQQQVREKNSRRVP